ncbi:hypothetical protein [Luethyella okanaganae]|uniref:Ribosomally synthesized peptide with SipW-like signal peptide n=1 Tax=Luethyella okanaganae TaxID=69372 RepID=A0ABW1VDN9_9MICO
MQETSERSGKPPHRTGRKRVLLSAALVIAVGTTSTAASIWIGHDTTVIFAAQGSDAFSISIAASPEADWRPAESDWQPQPVGSDRRTGSDHEVILPLTEDGQSFDLQAGTSKTVYVFVRNSSPELTGDLDLMVQPPAQSTVSDGLFDQLAFNAALDSGQVVLDGHGRSTGSLGTLTSGEVRRLTLTVTLPLGTHSEYLDRTTGVTLRFDAANR